VVDLILLLEVEVLHLLVGHRQIDSILN